MKRPFPIPVLPVVFSLVVAGCALMPGADFVPGKTTEAGVRASLGAPGKTYPAPGGGTLWVYPTGPMGEQTWMAHFNGQGVLDRFEQVLDQDHFWRVQPGMDMAQVNAILGPPTKEVRFDRLQQLSWDYRYSDAWGYVSEYSILFGSEDKVVGTFNKRLYPGRGRD
jgi:hypothetical protein